MRKLSVITYFDKIIPYLRVLLDDNKLYEQKKNQILVSIYRYLNKKGLHTFQDQIIFVYLQVTQVK